MMRVNLSRRRNCAWLSLLVCLLAGCAALPPAPSRTAAAAIRLNRDGQAAWQHGQYRQAQAAFEAALAIDMADENLDGMAINLLNLAHLDQLQGRKAAAHQRLAALLALPLPGAASHWQVDAATRQAQLYLSEGNDRQAARWVRQAAAGCRAGCTGRATIFNVQAEIALRRHDHHTATAAARAALSHSHAAGQRNERANALRLLGEIALRQQQPAAAQPLLSEALTLDKAVGLPLRIQRDLLLLGHAAMQGGQRAQADAYFQRARQVSAGLAQMPAALKDGPP